MKGKPLKFGKGIHHEIQKTNKVTYTPLTKEIFTKYLEELFPELPEDHPNYTGPLSEYPGWYKITSGKAEGTRSMTAYCGKAGWDMYQEALRKEAERLTLENDKV